MEKNWQREQICSVMKIHRQRQQKRKVPESCWKSFSIFGCKFSGKLNSSKVNWKWLALNLDELLAKGYAEGYKIRGSYQAIG